MRKIREVLRLRWELKLNQREISASCGLSRCSVGKYLRRANVAKLSWPLPDILDDDAALEARLFPPLPVSVRTVPQPDWPMIHREMARKGDTIQLLWQEYKEKYCNGYR